MGIQQISIFLENTAGRIADVTGVLKDAGINLRAIMIADTADFGILRVIADDSEKALAVLKNINLLHEQPMSWRYIFPMPLVHFTKS